MSYTYYLLPWENSLNALRVLVTVSILLYSCVTDWKHRRAPNELWYILGGIGLLLNIFEFFQYPASSRLLYVIWLVGGVAFIYILVYIFFRFGGFGGADAKALIAIAIVFPMYPVINLGGIFFPLVVKMLSPVFSLSVLGNAVALTIVVPVFVLMNNLTKVPLKELLSNPLGAVSAYKTGIRKVNGRFQRLQHRYEEADDGTVKSRPVFRGIEADEETLNRLKKWNKEGKIGDQVWVTPKLPFLIPITLGFIIAIFFGDILMLIVGTLMGR